jgi:hypothetical protein
MGLSQAFAPAVALFAGEPAGLCRLLPHRGACVPWGAQAFVYVPSCKYPREGFFPVIAADIHQIFTHGRVDNGASCVLPAGIAEASPRRTTGKKHPGHRDLSPGLQQSRIDRPPPAKPSTVRQCQVKGRHFLPRRLAASFCKARKRSARVWSGDDASGGRDRHGAAAGAFPGPHTWLATWAPPRCSEQSLGRFASALRERS